MSYSVKDSGTRQEFTSGMVRDTTEGTIDYRRVLEGPMIDRWAAHLELGAVKYPDVAPGVANWTLAEGAAELERFKASAFRHFVQWLRGDVDEDHAAAVFFNVNGAEYVKARKAAPLDASEFRLFADKTGEPEAAIEPVAATEAAPAAYVIADSQKMGGRR